MLMRAAGPALTQLGFTAAQVVTDPLMEFYNGSTKISENNDWNGDTSVLATAAAVGAFPYAGATSKDSAIYQSAIPLGNDSVKISGAAGNSGSIIAELYDATPTAQFVTTTPRLVNVSVLKNVGTGITVGFVIGGSTSMKVMIRAVGPGLSAVGVNSGTIADPKLTLFSSTNTSLATNDDWGTAVGTGAATAAQITAAANSVGAFAIPAGSKDAVILATLAPGLYTAQAAASTGATGLGIVEVYEVP
jgi:hypothetical protein